MGGEGRGVAYMSPTAKCGLPEGINDAASGSAGDGGMSPLDRYT